MATQVPYVAVPPGIASRVGSVFGRTGNVVAEAGDYSAAQIAGGLSRVATTGAAGFALQNATPTILSWTAPDDGQLHTIIVPGLIDVSSAATGGSCALVVNGVTLVAAGGYTWLNGNLPAATYEPTAPIAVGVPPGQTAELAQHAALTAGAATVYAEIWAS